MSLKIRKDPKFGFTQVFNPSNGFAIRGDIEHPDGGKEEPFMASAPELLDICITKFCEGPIVNGRNQLCSYCYMNSSYNRVNSFITINDFNLILGQVENSVFQIALGGGEPTRHPEFPYILWLCKHKYNIVPNYTTNGSNLNQSILKATKDYCGSVAVSLHEKNSCERAIRTLIDYGIKTNIHIVVRKSNINTLIEELDQMNLKGLNAVVFLLHKPVGRATEKEQPNRESVLKFVDRIVDLKKDYKIGFDACFAPSLVGTSIDPSFYDYCDGGRFSAFIDYDLMIYPCSFAAYDKSNGMSLAKYPFDKIWNSELFDKFRNQFKIRCLECSKVSVCGGGCSIHPQIVKCLYKEE